MKTVAPFHVKLRLARYLVVAAAAIFSPFIFWGPGSLLSWISFSFLAGLAGYVAWVFWPAFIWGTSAHRLSKGVESRFVLTFDDGPTPGLTDKVLDILARHGVKASFFVLTEKARGCPQLVQRMVQEGHTVGLHGKDHKTALFRSKTELVRDLSEAQATLEQLTGQKIDLFRPSHGWKTFTLRAVARQLGLQFCFWDVGVWDTDGPPVDILVKRLIASVSLLKCPVLLLHDGRDDLLYEPAHGRVLVEGLERFLAEMGHTTVPHQESLLTI